MPEPLSKSAQCIVHGASISSSTSCSLGLLALLDYLCVGGCAQIHVARKKMLRLGFWHGCPHTLGTMTGTVHTSKVFKHIFRLMQVYPVKCLISQSFALQVCICILVNTTNLLRSKEMSPPTHRGELSWTGFCQCMGRASVKVKRNIESYKILEDVNHQNVNCTTKEKSSCSYLVLLWRPRVKPPNR